VGLLGILLGLGLLVWLAFRGWSVLLLAPAAALIAAAAALACTRLGGRASVPDLAAVRTLAGG
jgi:hypothetical protein